jgi:SAM-dependent methyltransferase
MSTKAVTRSSAEVVETGSAAADHGEACDSMFGCRICTAQGKFPCVAAREMMFGSREEFRYFQCSNCGCLQISAIPDDLHRHYPSDYYSQHSEAASPESRGARALLSKHYCRTVALRSGGVYSRLLRVLLPEPFEFHEVGEYLRAARLSGISDGILDVGCGASPRRLAAMRRCGFSNVLGIDPFLPEDLSYDGVPVKRCRLQDLDGRFGLIMFHHSLEHVPDPVTSLRVAARLLSPGGLCLIRIPVMGTRFWQEFGVDWAELDAPRHLYLMSRRTVDHLCKEVGFSLESVRHDSSGWELAASELYRRDIPMFERTPAGLRSNLQGFSPSENARFEIAAAALNEAGDAGRACFYLRLSQRPVD